MLSSLVYGTPTGHEEQSSNIARLTHIDSADMTTFVARRGRTHLRRFA
jgi:hypothetical protein